MVTMVTMKEEEHKNILEEENTNFADQDDGDILDEEFLAKAYGSFQGSISFFYF